MIRCKWCGHRAEDHVLERVAPDPVFPPHPDNMFEAYLERQWCEAWTTPEVECPCGLFSPAVPGE